MKFILNKLSKLYKKNIYSSQILLMSKITSSNKWNILKIDKGIKYEIVSDFEIDWTI